MWYHIWRRMRGEVPYFFSSVFSRRVDQRVSRNQRPRFGAFRQCARWAYNSTRNSPSDPERVINRAVSFFGGALNLSWRRLPGSRADFVAIEITHDLRGLPCKGRALLETDKGTGYETHNPHRSACERRNRLGCADGKCPTTGIDDRSTGRQQHDRRSCRNVGLPLLRRHGQRRQIAGRPQAADHPFGELESEVPVRPRGR